MKKMWPFVPFPVCGIMFILMSIIMLLPEPTLIEKNDLGKVVSINPFKHKWMFSEVAASKVRTDKSNTLFCRNIDAEVGDRIEKHIYKTITGNIAYKYRVVKNEK